MPNPSTHQDSPKVPEWPVMELVRREGDSDLVQPWVPGPGENDLSGFVVEDFIPVSALLSATSSTATASSSSRQEVVRVSDPSVSEVADGLALWEEHKPQSAEDWIGVAERFVAAGGSTEKSSPLFAGLVLAVEQRDALAGGKDQ